MIHKSKRRPLDGRSGRCVMSKSFFAKNPSLGEEVPRLQQAVPPTPGALRIAQASVAMARLAEVGR